MHQPLDSIPIPTVRILFYADDPSSIWDPVSPGPGTLRGQQQEFGLGILKQAIESRSFIPRYVVEVLNRNFEYLDDGALGPQRASTLRLSTELLAPYDEVWFFGQHLAAFKSSHLTETEGGPDSELNGDEVAALRDWMDRRGGGILITGDHSNPVPERDVPDLADPSLAGHILNLGRALGHQMPRAGQMRIWVGPPGLSEGLVDTSGDTDMAGMPLQEDGIPQTMSTRVIEVRIGRWIFGRKRHPLFVRHSTDALTAFLGVGVFPDHGHEGALTSPADFTTQSTGPFPETDWPRGPGGVQPIPETVAIGTNRATGAAVALVSAYDGHAAGVGRIVADSTWHHYVNINLHGFRDGLGNPSEVLDEITDYYENLLWYLYPPPGRAALLKALALYLLSLGSVREILHGPKQKLGQLATRALGEVVSLDLVDDLVQSVSDLRSTHVGHHGSALPLLPPREWLWGSLLGVAHSHHGGKPANVDIGRWTREAMSIAAREYRDELAARAEAMEDIARRTEH